MNELKGCGMTVLVILAVIGAAFVFLLVTCLMHPLRIHG